MTPLSCPRLLLSTGNAATRSAESRSRLRDSRVLGGEGMALLAMRAFGPASRRVRPSEDVLSAGDDLQMRRADAGRDATEMIEYLPVRHSAMLFLPSPSVCRDHLPRAGKAERTVESAVALMQTRGPDPTRAEFWARLGHKPIAVNLLPEAFVRVTVVHGVDCTPERGSH